MYIQVQNELTSAYNELRNNEAMNNYNSTYRHLNKEDKKKVREKYPMKMLEITIAENH